MVIGQAVLCNLYNILFILFGPKISTGTSIGSIVFAMPKPYYTPSITYTDDDRDEKNHGNSQKDRKIIKNSRWESSHF